MEKAFQEIGLMDLAPNPHNPRKRFSGIEFEGLVESIRKKGVLQPILARAFDHPKLMDNKKAPNNGKMVTHEIVFGERRWRASLAAAERNGGPEGKTILAIVRKLSDEEAFDLMCIENLQREDLTEMEEAEGFKVYVDKRGEDSVPDLAERTGINPRYIRRRLAVLSLPAKTLKAWGAGKVKFGHLEQLCRLKDKSEILKYTDDIVSRSEWGNYTVKILRENIDNTAPALGCAKFDLEKAGCPACRNNSDVQTTLFELSSMKGTHCLDPKCFKKNQNNWLQANWKKTGYRKKNGTNGFRFWGDLGWNDFESFHGRTPKMCKICESFVTLLQVTGDTHYDRVCIGDKSCFRTNVNGKSSAGASSGGGGDNRKAWHGEYFREKFFQQALPMKLREIPVDDDVSAAVMLFALLKSNDHLHGWFREKRGLPAQDENYYSTYLPSEEIWKMVSGMSAAQAKEELKEASVVVVTLDRQDTESRRAIAARVGISLEKEWRITEEYLDKKTISEIRKIAEDFGVFEQPAAKTFLYEKLLKKRGSFKSCKKSELKRIFLESGVDLSGVVPEEVLGRSEDSG